MSENRSVFAQGAERLEQIARSLKSPHTGEGALQIASSRMTAISPDEAWARQFSSQCIGPICFKTAPGSDMKLPPLTAAIQSTDTVRQAAPPAHSPQRSAPTAVSKPVPMGVAIGKPPRRGFFGRLFRSA